MKAKTWEKALVAAVAAGLIAGVADVWAAQRTLEDKLIRLHVVAASDGDYDQSLKLSVRDAVTEELSVVLEDVTDRDRAEKMIREKLPEIETVCRGVCARYGAPYGVSVTLRRESFPTRNYDTFSLPAGEYLSLRVTLGEGSGRNWWCVVFPPVCAASSARELSEFDLTDKELAFITRDGREYAVRFRIAEVMGQIRDAVCDTVRRVRGRAPI